MFVAGGEGGSTKCPVLVTLLKDNLTTRGLSFSTIRVLYK